MTTTPVPPPSDLDVLVVGMGFAGLAAMHSLRTDHPDLRVHAIERADTAGGVWRENSYPGAACDVPTSLYSLSFAPNPEWSHTFGRQWEIHEYLTKVAEQFADATTYDCAMTSARWDENSARWIVETELGTIQATHLVAAPGALSEPGDPDIEGADVFSGNLFHSAHWDHSHDIKGRRVAVVGTGASAIQIVPSIVDQVESLTVFQRTPAWVVPRVDRTIGPLERAAYRRFPAVHRLVRKAVWAYREMYVFLMSRHTEFLPIAKAVAKAQLRIQVRDRKLRRRLTPDYTIGCKRMLLSNKWFPALQRKNSTLTGAISRLTVDGAVDSDGVEHKVDTVVFATGFTPTTPPIAKVLTGRDGRTLDQTWDGSPHAYRGMSVIGFPNLHFMYGPNTNLGHSSIVLMLEPQAHYISQVLSHLRTHGLETFEVTREAMDRYNTDIDAELDRSVWNSGGCSSWYHDASGRNSVMWPGYTSEFQKMMSQFVAADHTFTSARTTDTDPRHLKVAQ